MGSKAQRSMAKVDPTLWIKLSPGPNTPAPGGRGRRRLSGNQAPGAAQGGRPVLWVICPEQQCQQRGHYGGASAQLAALTAHDFLVHNTESCFSSGSSYSLDDSKIHRANPTPSAPFQRLFFNPKHGFLQILGGVWSGPGGGAGWRRVLQPHPDAPGLLAPPHVRVRERPCTSRPGPVPALPTVPAGLRDTQFPRHTRLL